MFDLATFVTAVGYIGVTATIFAETGLLIGFFLPGDSLLFTAGFLASQGVFHIGLLILFAGSAAVIGDSVGYTFGRRLGPKIFVREDSLLFHKDHIDRTRHFYEKHGGKTIILARFIPMVRTFAPILAGVGRMEYRQFLFYNIVGALIWACGIPLLGYFLGTVIPDVDRYLLPIILVIIFSSFLPTIYHLARNPKERQRLIDFVRARLKRTFTREKKM